MINNVNNNLLAYSCLQNLEYIWVFFLILFYF